MQKYQQTYKGLKGVLFCVFFTGTIKELTSKIKSVLTDFVRCTVSMYKQEG